MKIGRKAKREFLAKGGDVPSEIKVKIIRDDIKRLELSKANLQIGLHKMDRGKYTRALYIMDEIERKIRELYMDLDTMRREGEVEKEREAKRKVAWDKFVALCEMAGKCPENKPAVDSTCIGCKYLKQDIEAIPEIKERDSIRDLEGDEAKRFIEIDKRPLTEKEIETTKRSVSVYQEIKEKKEEK